MTIEGQSDRRSLLPEGVDFTRENSSLRQRMIEDVKRGVGPGRAASLIIVNRPGVPFLICEGAAIRAPVTKGSTTTE